MALIKCKECGKEMSKKATACPNCGKSTEAEVVVLKKETIGAVILIIAVVLVVVFVIKPFQGNSTTPPSKEAPLIEKLSKNKPFQISSTEQVSLIYNITRPALLTVEVIERFGKNIEFTVLQEGKPVYSSGVHSGKAQGTVKVDPGMISLLIVNENLIEEKAGFITVTARY